MKITDEQFNKVWTAFSSKFERYYRHMHKATKIEKDAFRSEFNLILLKAMAKFDLEKATATEDRFERYFMSSLKKRCNSIKRTRVTKRRKEEKQSISFSLKQHDIPDERIIPVIDRVSAYDVIQYCSIKLQDKGIVGHLWNGCSAKEACGLAGITSKEYRAIMQRIRINSQIRQSLSSN